MKHILVNLKRFDIPPQRGGVNRLADAADWAGAVLGPILDELPKWKGVDFRFYFPEAHLLPAVAMATSAVQIGCQSVSSQDTAVGGGFGAFTAERTANAMAAAGVTSVLVGHGEERAAIRRLLARVGHFDERVIDEEMSQRAIAAQRAGLSVTFCVGEMDRRNDWQAVIASQLSVGLAGLEPDRVLVAYEPIWAIGPGKTPPTSTEISGVAELIKQQIPNVPLVYGGGLKQDNAAMLANIKAVDGGLIALTRFSGDIGFYPDEYLEIVSTYLGE